MLKKLCLLFALFLLGHNVLAQRPLSESPQHSAQTLVYRISADEQRQLMKPKVTLSDKYLHTFVFSYPYHENPAAYFAQQPAGNYLLVGAVGEQIRYDFRAVDDLEFQFVLKEEVNLYLTDRQGNVIPDATVKLGRRTMPFDPALETYTLARPNRSNQVEVEHDGVRHLLTVHTPKSNRKAPFWQRTKWWFRRTFQRSYSRRYRDERMLMEKYTNYTVFSKPKYRPGDTVRMKTFIADLKGRPLDKPIVLELYQRNRNWRMKLDTLLPYRPGCYTGEFVLDREWDLQLDRDCYVDFRKLGGESWDVYGDGRFEYEDYELKRLNFFGWSEKKEKRYLKGEDAVIYLSALDENDMPALDGQVTAVVNVDANRWRQPMTVHAKETFVPDVLFTTEVAMDGERRKKVVIPADAFPVGVSAWVNATFTFLNSENEKRTATVTFFYDGNDSLIDFAETDGGVVASLLAQGDTVPARAFLQELSLKGDVLRADSVTLPVSLPLSAVAAAYSVRTEQATGVYYLKDYKGDAINMNFYTADGVLRLDVSDPAGLPYWYSVRNEDKTLRTGHGTGDMSLTLPQRGVAYHVQLGYMLGGALEEIDEEIADSTNRIRMDVLTPRNVQPGQTVDYEITLTDHRGKPLPNVDITAYGITSKFGSQYFSVPNYAKTLGAYPARLAVTYSSEKQPQARTADIGARWRDVLGLDSIEYYKFLQPEPLYLHTEDAPGGITQIAPYVILDGKVQLVYAIWIDSQPYYLQQAQQREVYSFPVREGLHSLTIRTWDRYITLLAVPVEKGKKTTLSVDARQSTSDSRVTVEVLKSAKEGRGVWLEEEVDRLTPYMISMTPVYSTIIPKHLTSAYRGSSYLKFRKTTIYDYSDATHPDLYYSHSSLNNNILVGPFPYLPEVELHTDSLTARFKPVGGMQYTFSEGEIRSIPWGKYLGGHMPANRQPSTFFSSYALREEDLARESRARVERMLQSGRFAKHAFNLEPPHGVVRSNDTLSGRIVLSPDAEKGVPALPLLTFFIDRLDSILYVYPGNTANFSKLPARELELALFYDNDRALKRNVHLRSGGTNYLQIDHSAARPDPEFSAWVWNFVQERLIGVEIPPAPSVPSEQSAGVTAAAGMVVGIVTGADDGSPIIGANVDIVGTSIGTSTRLDGSYSIAVRANDKLRFSFLGMENKVIAVDGQAVINVALASDAEMLDDVIVVAYGTAKGSRRKSGDILNIEYLAEPDELAEAKRDLTAALEGAVPGLQVAGVDTGIRIRGIGTATAGNIYGSSGGRLAAFPQDASAQDILAEVWDSVSLIIVDGAPFNGSQSDIEGDIASIRYMAPDEATNIFGDQARGGVLIITTTALELLAEDGAVPLRRNFHDDAFWQPALNTDAQGKASFRATYPDDITSWDAYFIAMGDKKSGLKKLNVRSFRTLTARLYTPRFAIEGDSLTAIGVMNNYLGDTLTVTRRIGVDRDERAASVRFDLSHTDTIPAVALPGQDTLRLQYSLRDNSGVFDGEEQTIPVLKPGVLQTEGVFQVISDDSLHVFRLDPALGFVTIHAEASAFEMLAREIDAVVKYGYDCNEQMASKVKALLLKKQLDLPGKERFRQRDKSATEELIRKLMKNRNKDGLWGWWSSSESQLWISRQVIEALLQAEQEGFSVKWNKAMLANRLQVELDRTFLPEERYFDKGEWVKTLLLLQRLDSRLSYAEYYDRSATAPDKTLQDTLLTIRLGQVAGTAVDTATLMAKARRTMMGGLYWGADRKAIISPWNYRPYRNETTTTLLAYEILREAGGREKELERIRTYFFEMRKNGSWRNTYESSRILETILPDLVSPGGSLVPTTAEINGVVAKELPYTIEVENTVVEVRKRGTAPLFFTAYQQYWEPEPEKRSEGLQVASRFRKEKDTLAELKAGVAVELEVLVNLDSDAEYVMIEVPIPAGCSYESRAQPFGWRGEVHREHFKEKVTIFCSRLSRGEHTFTVELLPRFTGRYHLNPAKAELMYFPTFYGREAMKIVRIE